MHSVARILLQYLLVASLTALASCASAQMLALSFDDGFDPRTHAQAAQWNASIPGVDPAAFRKAYLDHLSGRATYYDGLSHEVFGRSIPHVLLLHTNAINAAFLGDVIAMFRAQGWTLVAPAVAWRDTAYASRPTVLPAGESLLWSLAKERGMPGLRYPAEDDVYEKPLLDALGL